AFRRLNRIEEAISDYDAALQINSANATAFANRGLALAKARRYQEAIQDLTHAIKLNPGNAKTYLERGNAYFDKGDYAEAVKDYDSALERDPNLRLAVTNRDDALARILEPDKACTCNVAEIPTTAGQSGLGFEASIGDQGP